MNEMKNFMFGAVTVRVRKSDNGEPMFCLADVCKVLELDQVSRVKDRLRSDGVTISKVIDSMGRTQEATFISEQNLYKVIFQSRKPEAEKFTDWVTGEVLPTIRKTGGYMIANENETPEELCLRAMNILQDTVNRQKAQLAAQKEQITEQSNQLKLQAPDVEYCNTVLASKSLMTVGTIAAHLGVTAKKLNAFLDGEGWIYRQGKQWYPTIDLRKLGYCDYETFSYTNTSGENCSKHNLKWTEKGRRAVITLWNKCHNLLPGIQA